ncbi:MAG: serine/threonine-protein kinase [Pedosphaera sp.]|nr:serine/threonine-protein kinase [Pedosphaera sp.]
MSTIKKEVKFTSLVLLITLHSLVNAQAGTIFYTEPNGFNAISAVSTTNGGAYGIGNNSPYGTPSGIAVSPDGSLYVSYPSSNVIIKYTTTGQSIFLSGISNANVLEFDNPGNLYCADGAGTINKLSSGGVMNVYAVLPGSPSGMTFDASGNLFAVVGVAIYKIATNGGVSLQAMLPGLSRGPAGVAIDHNGNLFAASTTFGNDGQYYATISKITPDGTVTNFFTLGLSLFTYIAGPAIDGSDNLFISAQTSRNFGAVTKVLPDGSSQQISSSFSFHGGVLAYSPFDATLSDLPGTPTIIGQPQSQTTGAGSTVIFSVHAEVAPFGYQWYFNTTNLITGATNSSLTLNNVQVQQSGAYSVVITNSLGSATSQQAMLSVLPSLQINLVPAISLFGGAGLTYNVQFINAVGPTNAPWTTLATVTLTNSPQFFPDYSAIGQPVRFYRTVQVP